MSIVFNIVKYLLEGLAVAMATSIVSKGKMSAKETVMLALSAAAVFLILDLYAPFTAQGARHGSGFGLGFNMVTGVPLAGGSLHENMTGGGDPNMCGGGASPELDSGFKTEQVNIANINDRPYRLVASQYGRALTAGFNQNAEAYNEEALNTMSAL